jgi:hypothetical protein
MTQESANNSRGGTGGISSLLASDAVRHFLPANGTQNSAGNRFFRTVTTLQNATVARCMDRYRFVSGKLAYARYDERYVDVASPVVPGWAGENESLVPNLYDLPPLAHGGLLEQVLTGSPNPPQLPAAQANAISADYSNCRAQAAQSFKALNYAGFALGREWARRVTAIQESVPVKALARGFGSCVERYGAPPASAASPDAFSWWLGNLVQPSLDPAAVKTPIAVRVTQDHHWTQIFVGCAQSLLSTEGRLQLEAQKAFLQAHYQQVLTLRDLARKVLARLQSEQ